MIPMAADTPSSLLEQVAAFVRTVPYGKVVSYGDVGKALGIMDARTIGNLMHATGDIPGVPWWRVVGNAGKITIKDPAVAARQKELLEAEGVRITSDSAFDIERYRFGAATQQQRLI